MVRIRLQRAGRRNLPFFRIVVIDQRARRQGRPLATLGTYDPLKDPIAVSVDRGCFDDWVKKGAQPTPAVRMIVRGEKLKKKMLPKKKRGTT